MNESSHGRTAKRLVARIVAANEIGTEAVDGGRIEVKREDAVHLLRGAGGVPVFAHPGLADRDELIPCLVAAGLMGIECHYSEHPPVQRGAYLDLWREHGCAAGGVGGPPGQGGEGAGVPPSLIRSGGPRRVVDFGWPSASYW